MKQLRSMLAAGTCAFSLAVSATEDRLHMGRSAGSQFVAPGKTRQQVIETLISAMKAQHMPAPYGFVNAKAIDSQPETHQGA